MQPLFQTGRLQFNAPTVDETPEYIDALYNDPEVMRYLGTVEESLETYVPKRLAWRAELGRERGYTFWTVRLAATGEFVGCCGLQPIMWKGPEIELGYHTARKFWRSGYTSEAALACLQRGLDVHGLDRVIAVCIPENTGSWKVMERIGMNRVGFTEQYYEMNLLLYDAHAATWVPPVR